ncbi:phosphatase PAP2 family protein [Variovorax paradoxus]|uniref:Phosphatase PAP2 family protein n=1 Tax=Variovorax paradoxus TaxID=34073 RepID=A0A6I6HLC2_VARPD|nr:phosphatase PAP2 family protein [Variovorax paradoxus]QGW83731.1 phosphatase PAP2 family protein [Variovorax paradoxus]
MVEHGTPFWGAWLFHAATAGLIVRIAGCGHKPAAGLLAALSYTSGLLCMVAGGAELADPARASDFLSWTLLLALLLHGEWRAESAAARERCLWIWALAMPLLFILAGGELWNCALPALPAWSLLIADKLSACRLDARSRPVAAGLVSLPLLFMQLIGDGAVPGPWENLDRSSWREASFLWMQAGHAAHPLVLPVSLWLAEGTAWIAAASIGWAFWRRQGQRRYLVGCLAVGVFASIVAHQIAGQLALPRPFMVGLSINHLQHGARGSLPSTHASVMFAIAATFLYRPGLSREGVGILALAVVTGWARVSAGAHFPADVLAGLLLGLMLASAWVLLQRVPTPGAPTPSLRAQGRSGSSARIRPAGRG